MCSNVRHIMELHLWETMLTRCYRLEVVVSVCICSPLKPSSIEVLCSGIENVAQTLCPALLPKASLVAAKFRAILTLYSQCHHGYNEGVITDVEIDQLGILLYYIVCYLLYVSECRRTHAFLAFYRQSFPLATILPKMHNGRPCDSLAKEMENRLRLDGGTRSRIDTLPLEQRFKGVLTDYTL